MERSRTQACAESGNMPNDGPVVYKQDVANSAQSCDRLVLIGANRFVRKISAGGNHWKSQFTYQQMMQRCIRHRADSKD